VSDLKKVLILCTGNSCRSILAEATLRELGRGRFESWSAGSKPTGQVHPLSLETLGIHGIDTGGLKSQSWDEFEDIDFDLVITVCDNANGESCPAYLSKAIRAHWGVFDPPKVRVEAGDERLPFEEAYQILKFRIEELLNLNEDEINSTTLNEIGKLNPQEVRYV